MRKAPFSGYSLSDGGSPAELITGVKSEPVEPSAPLYGSAREAIHAAWTDGRSRRPAEDQSANLPWRKHIVNVLREAFSSDYRERANVSPVAESVGAVALDGLVIPARPSGYKGRHRMQPEPIGVAEYVPLDVLMDGADAAATDAVDGALADAAQLPTMELPIQPQPGYASWNSDTVPLYTDWNSPTVQHPTLPQPVPHQRHDEPAPVA